MKLQIAKWVEPTLDYLWDIRKRIIQDEERNKAHLGDFFGFSFRYPEYAGLPKKISSQIPDHVTNIINDETYFTLTNYKTKKAFCKEMLSLIANSSILVSS